MSVLCRKIICLSTGNFNGLGDIRKKVCPGVTHVGLRVAMGPLALIAPSSLCYTSHLNRRCLAQTQSVMPRPL